MKKPFSAMNALRSRVVKEPGRYADVAAVVVILILTAIAGWDLIAGGMVAGMDSATQFYPWYSYLGESLRSFDIPGWNPHQFSGTPFAADPLSGWTYLPAMLFFTLLPLELAAWAFLVSHLLMAGLFTYALARTLELNVPGALLAAVAYEFASVLYVRNTCCVAFAGVVVWLPLAILGAELAIRSASWLNRALWCGISGLALSQILASWLGQGAYYGLLALGGYVAYRAVVSPPENVRGLWGRALALIFVGSLVLVFGFGLAAAGIVPRLEYNELSNLAGGYTVSPENPSGEWDVNEWALLIKPGIWYGGAAVLALALAALLLWPTHFAVPYLAFLSLGALTLSGQLTLLHKILYLLPVFDRLHPNASARVMVVFFLGSALLAGTALTALMERSPRPAYFAFLPALAALFLATRAPSTTPERVAAEVSRFDGWGTRSPALIEAGVIIPPAPLVALILTVALAATLALFPDRLSRWRLGISVVLVLVVFVDLFGSGKTSISNHISAPGGAGLMTRLDVSEYYAPTGRVQFLRSAGDDPSRYLTYAPGFRKSTSSISSPLRFAQPETPALGAGNRAAVDGLQSVQGYNALRLALYDEYMLELNEERTQNYHYADVLAEESLSSPLLDLLGARHIVVPAGTGEDREPSGPEQEFAAVYEDDQVKVLERSEALPRAWIVHSAQSATPKEALRLLSSGEVDPQETALLEDTLPDLANSDDPSADRASVTEYGPDEIRLNTRTDTSSLLMLGEVYYPAWNAYVDGERVPLYRADHLLRAIPIPAGEHTVELRYESRSLQAGMIISLATILALLALTAAKLWEPTLATLPFKLRKGKNDGQ